MGNLTHYVGPAIEMIKLVEDNSVDLVCTSPPFLGLRNYNNCEGQYGNESTPAEFINNLLDLVNEIERVLTPTGSIVFELGDTYAGSGGAGGDYNQGGQREKQPKFVGSARRDRAKVPRNQTGGYGWPQAKSLCGIPDLFTLSLAYGHNLLDPVRTLDPWRIRNKIAWARNNPPVGALGDKFRPATSYITVATKSQRRWFDLDPVRNGKPTNDNYRGKSEFDRNGKGRKTTSPTPNHPGGSPPLDHWHDEHDGDLIWNVNNRGSKLGHFAMFPAQLVDRIVLSMCPPRVCRECGEPVERVTKLDGHVHKTIGWSECGHDDYRRGLVLDPFFGAGTTGHVANLRGRDAIGIDIDPTNQELHAPRLEECRKSLFGAGDPTPIEGQTRLFAS